MKYFLFSISALVLTACGSDNNATPVPNDEVTKTCTAATAETPEICVCVRGTEATACPT